MLSVREQGSQTRLNPIPLWLHKARNILTKSRNKFPQNKLGAGDLITELTGAGENRFLIQGMPYALCYPRTFVFCSVQWLLIRLVQPTLLAC